MPAAPSTQLAYVLDDEPEVATLVARALTAAGYAPRDFSEPAAFLAQVRLCMPQLVVLDLALGQSDAVEIIRQLEALGFDGRVLLISGRDASLLSEIEQIGRRHGLAMLPPLAKPFRLQKLKETVGAAAAAPMAGPRARASRSAQAETPRVDLETALREGWLQLWYQPKIDLKSGSICGAEALLRGHHPEHGIVSPAGLLPPAGDPLYRPLTHFVLRHAMADWARLSEQQQPLKLAINVPVSVVHTPDFIDLVRKVLPRAAGFPGLVFEITEDEMIRDSDLIRDAATQLGLYGVSMSIDDFGAAYSSLSRLKDLPFSELKIDQSFVANCATDKLNHSLCQVVTELGHRFDATVCAEGVENAADLRALVEMGCDTAQGFLFARPLCFDDFLTYLRAPPDWSLFEAHSRSAVARGASPQ